MSKCYGKGGVSDMGVAEGCCGVFWLLCADDLLNVRRIEVVVKCLVVHVTRDIADS